jgi:uncharacterized oxidoreductase
MHNHISIRPLEDFITALFTAGGFNAAEARATAESLVLSEIMGHPSHGVIRVKEYLKALEKGDLVSGATLQIIQETPSSLFADAQIGIGQVIMPMVLEKLHYKLTDQATVTAAVRNCGHIGRLGEWVARSAQLGYASLLLVNDNGVFRNVAPPGGKQRVTSTNPLAFAIPLAGGEIFMADMSTSAIAAGKVHVAHLNGQTLPPHCLQDSGGNPTTDPAAFYADPPGSILPMGGAQGYKGFALSMFIDLLVAGLSGGQTPPATPDAKGLNNFTFMLWSPAYFAGADHLISQAEKYLDFIRHSAPIDPAKPIRLPGDRMLAMQQEHERNGLSLSPQVMQDLIRLAQKLNVAVPNNFAGDKV